MKSMARAILFGGIIVATGAAVADMVSSAMGETDKDMAASSMPADPQAGDPAMRAESAASTEGAAADLAATSTYTELQPGDSMAVTPSPSPDIVAAVPPPAESVRAPCAGTTGARGSGKRFPRQRAGNNRPRVAGNVCRPLCRPDRAAAHGRGVPG